MKAATYTLLLTVIDDGSALPTISQLEDHIQQTLEEGTDRHAPHVSAIVHAMNGDQISTYVTDTRMLGARRLHRETTRNPG